MGGGSGGGIGAGTGPYVVGGGVRSPIPLLQPLPPYTEAARKARVEGLVLLQAVVRKDGTVDSFRCCAAWDTVWMSPPSILLPPSGASSRAPSMGQLSTFRQISRFRSVFTKKRRSLLFESQR